MTVATGRAAGLPKERNAASNKFLCFSAFRDRKCARDVL